MKKTKLLTSLVALALVVSLGACEVNVGDVNIGGDSSDTTDTEPSEPSSSDTGSTPSEPEEDSSSSSSTPEEPPVVTHEYSIEVENADALKELTYDGNATTQQGVQLSIYLVDTPSEGTPTREAATENDVTFTVSDPTVVTVSGLTVLPLKEGSTSITIAWADKANTSVDVLVTDITVNEPEGPTSWADLVTGAGDYDKATALLGATLDEILPFYYEEQGFQSALANEASFRVTYYNPSATLTSAWTEVLVADGWTQGETTSRNSGFTTVIPFDKDGYTIEITYDSIGDWQLDLYPPVDTGDEGGEDLETAQAILNAAAAQTSYYGGFGNLHIDGQVPESGVANYTTTISGDLTIDDNNNVFGKFQWANSDEPGPKIRYYYEKYYYYDNMSTNGSHSYQASPSSIGVGSSKNTINGVLDDRLPTVGFSSTYTCAFTNASSIDLASATDLELTTEDNGNYKLTLIYNDIWYCYKATSDCELVGAGYSTNWTSSTNFEIVYGEQTTRAAIDEIMNDEFFSVETWFPKEVSDEEIAASILESAEDTTITWSAFHGEYIDESTDETDTLYLTTDSDGLYGSGICLDDGDPSFEYYYKNGKEYVHNSNNDSYYDGDFYYGDTYADILSDFTSDALDNADWPDLDDDDWTLTTLTDGYELVVDTYLITTGYKTTQAQLVYITDTNFNITGLGYATFDSTFGNIEGWYAEQATTAQVEASLAGFDPANWGEGEEEPANPGSSTVVDSDSIEDALSLLLEYGADTSSWSGVAFQDVIDYSENMYGFLNIDLEKIDETILATEKDGVVTGLDEDLFYLYGELYEDYSEYEYYDGTTLHSLDYGSYSSEEASLDLSYFTSYPLSQVQYDIAYFTQFSGLTTLYSYLGYEFDGGIKVSDDAITVTASVSAYQEGDDDEDYGEYQETLTVSLEIVYDLDGGLISSSFNYIDYLYYPSIYSSLTYSQTTTCSDFTGTIDTPTWVVNA